MGGLLARGYDNYVVNKLKSILQNRSYTTLPQDIEKVKNLLQNPNDLFLLNQPLSTKLLAESLKKIDEASDHQVYEFSFLSPHLSTDKVNNQVYGKFYQSKEKPEGPTVIILPGWMTYREEKYYSSPLGKMLLKAGLNYVFYCLPYHMERRPGGFLSGELAVSGDIYRTLVFFRQAISENRTIIYWLKRDWGMSSVGVLGLSLGGWIASHLLHLEAELDFGVLMIPAVEPAAILWQTRIGKLICQDLQKQGFTQEGYKQLVKPLEPAQYHPAIDPKKILIIKGKYDQCVPGESIDRFARMWRITNKSTYQDGHFSILLRKKPIKEIINFIWNEK